MFLFKLLFKKINCPNREDKLEYGYTIQRYMAILLDLCLMVMILKFYQDIFAAIFRPWFQVVDFDILRKSQMDLPLSDDEKSRVEIFKIRVLIMNFSQYILVPLYLGFSWYYLGGSPGQILTSLRIVNDSDGSRMTVKQIVKRLGAGILTVCTAMLGFLWSFIDKKRQSLHDKIAKTIIVTKQSLQDTEKYNPRLDIADKFILPYLKKFFIFIKLKFMKSKWKKLKKIKQD